MLCTTICCKELSEIISIYKKKEDNDSTLFLKLNFKIFNFRNVGAKCWTFHVSDSSGGRLFAHWDWGKINIYF